ncbi:MAG: hypothetical protein O6922_06785 [Chloroflexi bacterium]|nr:hypothetical protein [Chloroflexota bacterium]
MALSGNKFAAIVLVIFALMACESGGQATPTPSVGGPSETTPIPVITSADGITRIVVHLSAVHGDGQIGSAILVADGANTTVEIDVGPITGEAQPIHLHTGTCEDVGSVVHALQNVVNGKSNTTLDLTLEEILAGAALVNVHASYADLSTYTACGQLPAELP